MRTVRLLAATLLLVAAGCTTPSAGDVEIPSGWSCDLDNRWWTAPADTAAAYRNLSSLSAMGLGTADLVAATGAIPSTGQAMNVARNVRRVQQRLLPLFRNHPEIVDSLFRQRVLPDLIVDPGFANPEPDLEPAVREAYRRIARHFRDARAVRTVGRDIPLSLPRDLGRQVAGRRVLVQVRVDTSGVPVALLRLEGVEPIADLAALRAITDMRWQPAYLLRGSRSEPVASWVRVGIRFPGRASDDASDS